MYKCTICWHCQPNFSRLYYIKPYIFFILLQICHKLLPTSPRKQGKIEKRGRIWFAVTILWNKCQNEVKCNFTWFFQSFPFSWWRRRQFMAYCMLAMCKRNFNRLCSIKPDVFLFVADMRWIAACVARKTGINWKIR